jgi:hypothetical protein
VRLLIVVGACGALVALVAVLRNHAEIVLAHVTSSVVVNRRPQSGNRTEWDHRNNSRGLLLVLQEPFEIGYEPCPQPVAQFGWRNIGPRDLSFGANLVCNSWVYSQIFEPCWVFR